MPGHGSCQYTESRKLKSMDQPVVLKEETRGEKAYDSSLFNSELCSA